jgi:hypothetical protein
MCERAPHIDTPTVLHLFPRALGPLAPPVLDSAQTRPLHSGSAEQRCPARQCKLATINVDNPNCHCVDTQRGRCSRAVGQSPARNQLDCRDFRRDSSTQVTDAVTRHELLPRTLPFPCSAPGSLVHPEGALVATIVGAARRGACTFRASRSVKCCVSHSHWGMRRSARRTCAAGSHEIRSALAIHQHACDRSHLSDRARGW